MSPDLPPVNLDQTIAAKWRTRLAGEKGEDRAHWRTKTAYYRAVLELLTNHQSLTWSSIVAAVHPKGSRSTFYDVTGPRAKHALLKDYLAAARSESLQLALCFRRQHAVEQLIDEAKVWSYWPTRQSWLAQTRQNSTLRTVDSMLVALTRWARMHPEIAAALDHTPPACAVEDLIALHHGQLPAIRAWEAIRRAITPAPGSPGYPGVRPDDDHRADPPPPATPDPRIFQLAEQLCAVRREMRMLEPNDALAVREAAAALMTVAAF